MAGVYMRGLLDHVLALGHAPLMLIGPWIKAHNFASKGPTAMKLGATHTSPL